MPHWSSRVQHLQKPPVKFNLFRDEMEKLEKEIKQSIKEIWKTAENHVKLEDDHKQRSKSKK